MDFLAKQDKKGVVCPAVVIVTSSGELVSQMYEIITALIEGNGNEGSAIKSIQVIQRRGQDGKSLAGFNSNLPTILVCTPGRLAYFIQQPKFSARLLHPLVVCQGPSLASARFFDKMQKIVAWARCLSPTGARPTSTPAPCPLTTVVLSRSFERDSVLHRELEDRYLKDFICTADVTREELGRRPVLSFGGKIEVRACPFNIAARLKDFIENILPFHEDESILCMNFSSERAMDFASECDELGVPCQVFTKELNNPMTMQDFRSGECKIMVSTPVGFEGLRHKDTRTGVVLDSPCKGLYADAHGPKPEQYKRRTDYLRTAIESVGHAGKEATVYIFVGQGTAQPIKNDIAKVLRQAGYEVPSVLKPRTSF